MKYCGHHKLDPDSLWCWCWLGGWWPIPYVAKSIAEYTNMTYFSVILCRSWLDSTKMSLVDTCQNRFHNVWSNCSNKFYYVSHSEHQRIRGMGGLFTNSKCISEVIWRMEESGGFWWLHCRPITCFPPHTRWPDLRCGTFVRPVWFVRPPLSDLSVHLCLQLTCVSFVWAPLSDDRRLAQMTRLSSFVKPSRASFTRRKPGPCVSMRCPCSHSPRSPGVPGPYLASSSPLLLSPLCLASCKGNLRGAAVSPSPNLLLPPMRFIGAIAAFSQDLVGKLDGNGKILGAMAWLVLPDQIYRFCFVALDCQEKKMMMMRNSAIWFTDGPIH